MFDDCGGKCKAIIYNREKKRMQTRLSLIDFAGNEVSSHDPSASAYVPSKSEDSGGGASTGPHAQPIFVSCFSDLYMHTSTESPCCPLSLGSDSNWAVNVLVYLFIYATLLLKASEKNFSYLCLCTSRNRLISTYLSYYKTTYTQLRP